MENAEPLLRYLLENGEKVLDDHQQDEYYTPAHRDFTAKEPIDEWLRLRQSGTCSVTYKNWHHDSEGKSTHCDEYETSVDDLDQLRKILTSIDIRHLITVDKYRQSWNVHDFEVSIDKVAGLGDFVEVEYKGSSDCDPKAITDEMISFLKKADVGKIQINYVGYPFLLLHPDGDYFEAV